MSLVCATTWYIKWQTTQHWIYRVSLRQNWVCVWCVCGGWRGLGWGCGCRVGGWEVRGVGLRLIQTILIKISVYLQRRSWLCLIFLCKRMSQSCKRSCEQLFQKRSWAHQFRSHSQWEFTLYKIQIQISPAAGSQRCCAGSFPATQQRVLWLLLSCVAR